MKRFSVILALLALCLSFSLITASAAESTEPFSGELNRTEGHGRERVSLTVSYNGSYSELGAFLVQVNYDASRFTCTRVTRSGSLQSGFTASHDSGGSIRAVYSMNGYPLTTETGSFTCYFEVKEGAEAGETSFELAVTQTVSEQPVFLGSDFYTSLIYTVLPEPSKDASLLAAVPSTGELVPEFSPDISEYTLSVPYDITSITFETEAAEGAECKVNRKNLGAGGSNTEFTLTVTAEDGKTKQVYTVKVHREEKVTPTPTPKSTGTPKPTATAKATATPKASAAPKPTASPTVEPTALPDDESTESSDNGEAAGMIAESDPPTSGTSYSQSGNIQQAPSLTIENGNQSLLPFALVMMFWVLVLFISKPLAKLICEKFDKDDEDEDR